MSIYVTRAHSKAAHDGWGYYDSRDSVVVTESDRAPINTGLLNADGTPLYRLTVCEQIGFVIRR